MELRVKTRKEGEDPIVFSSSITPGEKRKVFFPQDIPDDKKAKCLPVIAKLFELCEKAGFEVLPTTKKIDNSTWNILETLDEAITGSYYCLNRGEKITPVENVPKAIERGWDYALWYCFASGAHASDYNEGFKIHRVTSMLSADKGSWGGAAGKFTDLDRVQSIIRFCAQSMSKNLGPLPKFLKSKGYFVNKFVGKKPVAGLYTHQELTLLEVEWEARKKAIEAKFDLLPKDFSTCTKDTSINNHLSKLQVELSKESKVIEGAKTKRIPELLITEGRGRAQKKVIAKGSTLPEKLKHINGGDSVRTIAKTLYSPYYNTDLTQGEFVQVCMAETKDRNMRVETTYINSVCAKYKANSGKCTPLEVHIVDNLSDIELVVQTYLEVIPDKVGSTAWDATFGVFKLK